MDARSCDPYILPGGCVARSILARQNLLSRKRPGSISASPPIALALVHIENAVDCPLKGVDLRSSLSGAAKFVSNRSPQSRLQGLLLPAHETAQRLVNKRLVVSASCVINLLTKPVQNVIIQPDRDPGFSGGRF